jgi:uncharacterized protein (DUF362 family)
MGRIIIDRREFARLAALGLLGTSTAYLTGCARLLEWSDAQRAAPVRRTFGRPGASATPTGSPTATGSADASKTPAAPPDLAVARGDDPTANTTLAVAMLGGMERFVRRGDRVVVKPNILTAKEPQFAATTNPSVVAAVVRMCWEAGAADVTVLDNPTAPPRQAYTVSGIAKAVSDVDGRMKVLSDRDFELIEVPGAKRLASWPLVTDIFEADAVVNIPCAKNHGLAGLTMSMKNLMGIMGGHRGQVHQSFADKIVDLNSLVKPQLIVLDATRLLVRNGPSGGSLSDVRPGRTIVAGTNAVSVDAYGSTLFGRGARSLEYVRLAEKRGLGSADLDTLAIEERST